MAGAQKKHNYVRNHVIDRGAVDVRGSWAPNGSSAVAAASNKGMGWTVARTSAGLFTLTFDEKYQDVISATATLQLATGDDKFVQVGSFSQANRTLTVRVWDVSGAAETDVAANANNRINFHVTFACGKVRPLHS